jgi:hypothetical protein
MYKIVHALLIKTYSTVPISATSEIFLTVKTNERFHNTKSDPDCSVIPTTTVIDYENQW